MSEPLQPWKNGHKHKWTYFGGMASCNMCAARLEPYGQVLAPNAASKKHRLLGLQAKEKRKR